MHISDLFSNFVPERDILALQSMETNRISLKVKELRKQYNLTQEDLAIKSGVGLRFLRELEQGKPTVRMDKINQVLNLFNLEVGVCDKERSM